MCGAVGVVLDLLRRACDLFTSQAGEGSSIVNRDLRAGGFIATTATASTTEFTSVPTATIFTSFTTTSAAATELATVRSFATFRAFRTVAAIRTFRTVTTIAAELATTTTTSRTATAAATSVARLLLEAVVNVEEFLLGFPSTLASSLLLALEVVCIFLLGELLGGLPFLVLLGSLIGCTSLLEAEITQFLGCLLSQIIGIRLAVVFWLGLLFGVSLAAWSSSCTLCVGIEAAFLDFL